MYEDSIKHINSLSDEAIEATGKTRDELIQAAKEQRDETVKLAEEMHLATVDEISAMMGSSIDYIDTGTGEILTNWQKFKQTWWRDLSTWASETYGKAVEAGKNLVDGFFNKANELLTRAGTLMSDVGTKIRNSGNQLWSSARSAASNLWEGFKKGLGISSPSYLEEAMNDIMLKAREMRQKMGIEFDAFGRMKVNSPGLDGLRQILNSIPEPQDMDETVALVGAAPITNVFRIDKMEVRDDSDIEKIALKLYELQRRRKRGS